MVHIIGTIKTNSFLLLTLTIRKNMFLMVI